MSIRVQRRRGSAASHATFIGADGEITINSDEKRVVVHDAATPGGIPMARKDEVTAEVLRVIGNADFLFQPTDRIVVPNAVFSAPRSGTLPLASAVAAGRTISFFDVVPALNGANILSVLRTGTDTINGAPSFACATPRGRWNFTSDGVSKWSVEVVSASSVANVPAGGIAATTVQGALNELDTKKAPLASPALTGTPTAPTAATGASTTQIATTAFVKAMIDAIVSAAPGALDTLNELALALGNDPNFATTVTNLLAGKQPLDGDLTAIAQLISAADTIPYFNGAGSAALANFTAQARSLLAQTTAAAQRDVLIANPRLASRRASGGFTGDLPAGAANERLWLDFVKGPGTFGAFHCDTEVSRITGGSLYAYISLRLTNFTDGGIVHYGTEESTLELTNSLAVSCSKSIVVNNLVEGKTYRIGIFGRASAVSSVNSSTLRIEGFEG